ncbi:MAG: hypothetical protein ACXV96_08600 [Candidatus Angelobacter sp.]
MQHRITSILNTLLIAGMCSAPLLRAQQTSPTNPTNPTNPINPSMAQQPPETSQQAPAQNTQAAPPAGQNQPQQPAGQQSVNPGTSVNPSQAPLQPVTTYPDAAGAEQGQPSPNAAPQTTSIPEGPQPTKPAPAEPVGAATAESVPTSGGAAAKPAGIAIAPAKQHQTRSLLFKIGAVVAAGAALGTVYALSHGTSSTPPGTGLPGVTGR